MDNESSTIIGGLPPIPSAGWVHLGAVATALHDAGLRRQGLDRWTLAEKAKFLRLDAVEWGNDDLVIRDDTLPDLLTRPDLDAIAPHRPGWGQPTVPPYMVHKLLDLSSQGLGIDDVFAFVERRGVSTACIRDRAAASLAGIQWLRRIIDRERAVPIDHADWHAMRDTLPLLRAATIVEPDDAEQFAGKPIAEFRSRCDQWSIRHHEDHDRPDVLRLRRSTWVASGFDVFRMLGTAPPGADVERYRSQMTSIYDEVIPSRLVVVPVHEGRDPPSIDLTPPGRRKSAKVLT
jgi:hypothetical protein